MKVELSNTPLLSPQAIGEAASTLDAIHERTLKAIERLQKDVEARKAEIAHRWKSAGIDAADKARFAQSETTAAIGQIKDTAKAELDRLLKEVGPVHAKIIEQRKFYTSPVQVLSRIGLGESSRTTYLQQLSHAGPAELGHMAQVAVATSNRNLAAAVLSLLDKMPTKERPCAPVALARAMELDEYNKVQEYLKLADLRLQGIVSAIRAWNLGKTNPLNTVALALRERAIDRSVIEETEDHG